MKSKKFISFGLLALMLFAFATTAFASEATPTSLLDSSVTQVLEDLAADLKPTVLALISIVVTASVGIWALGFGVNKGIAKLQKAARKSF